MKVFIMNWNGIVERMVAAKSKKAAAESLGTTLYQFNLYGSDTDSADDVAVAMSNPGAVFEKPFSGRGEWKLICG